MEEVIYFQFFSLIEKGDDTLMRSAASFRVDTSRFTDEDRKEWMQKVIVFAGKSLMESQQ